MAFTPKKSKREIRDELNQQIQDFLERGGAVNECERGLSGREINQPLPVPPIEKNLETRTPVNEVVAAVEARKQPASKKPKTTKNTSPKKILVTDDFGEPVRWVWSDAKN